MRPSNGWISRKIQLFKTNKINRQVDRRKISEKPDPVSSSWVRDTGRATRIPHYANPP